MKSAVGVVRHTSTCNTNLDKVKCYSCGDMGHIGANCPKKAKESRGKEGKGKDAKGKDNKGNGGKPGGAGQKGKGKKGGKHGKKGKMNEVAYNGEAWEDGQEWSQEWGGCWQASYSEQQSGQSAASEMGGTQAARNAPLQMSSLRCVSYWLKAAMSCRTLV